MAYIIHQHYTTNQQLSPGNPDDSIKFKDFRISNITPKNIFIFGTLVSGVSRAHSISTDSFDEYVKNYNPVEKIK